MAARWRRHRPGDLEFYPVRHESQLLFASGMIHLDGISVLQKQTYVLAAQTFDETKHTKPFRSSRSLSLAKSRTLLKMIFSSFVCNRGGDGNRCPGRPAHPESPAGKSGFIQGGSLSGAINQYTPPPRRLDKHRVHWFSPTTVSQIEEQ